MKPVLPRWLSALALVLGLVWAGFLLKGHIAGAASVIDRFETVLLDLRILLAGQRLAPEDVVIVAIDDQTVARTGQYPLARNRLADLVDAINEAGARSLAVDILLFGASDSADDTSLARAIGSLPTVIAGAAHVGEAQPAASVVPVINKVLSPAPELAEHAAIGLANIVTDSGGTPRHVPLLFLSPEGLQPSFGLQALGLFQGEPASLTETGIRMKNRVQPLDIGWHLALNYYGPEGTIRTISADSLLEGKPVDLRNRLVVLGVTATAVGDRFSTPFDPVMPGVEVQATGLANLLDGSPLVRDPTTRLIDSAAALTITALGLIAVVFLPLAPASVFYIVLLGSWLAVSAFLFGQGLWLNGALPFAASLPPVIGLIITRQLFDRFQSRQLMRAQEALSRFQSPQLAGRIAEDPAFLSEPREQDAVILFVDLSGYTGLSEELGAVRTRDFLKEFHTIVVDVVSEDNGVVLDFMGDGAMLGFGIPDVGTQDPVHAVRCAFKLGRAIGTWLEGAGMATTVHSVRVGAHCGNAVLSRLGHDSQQQITATGDCVNVASRLLEVAKDHGASVVISAELLEAYEDAGREKIVPPRLETVSIRGRRQALQVGLWASGDISQFSDLDDKPE
ncbi:CHASE2 domain-containing protein [Roseibium sp. MMSF_3544]|uniref:CHASE2 domain-containing protein n=1 Tax=unclassified Roseibium TaxID=2629323 RepID=UPI00273E2FB1|nr:adenylate/guanylate cyclase domain-containing protein [Roseibium sp. MMSF_3544]